jgi:thiamine transport system permease protein
VSLGEFGATSFLSRSGTMTVPIAIGQLLGRPGPVLQQAGFALATTVVAVVLFIESVGLGNEPSTAIRIDAPRKHVENPHVG